MGSFLFFLKQYRNGCFTQFRHVSLFRGYYLAWLRHRYVKGCGYPGYHPIPTTSLHSRHVYTTSMHAAAFQHAFSLSPCGWSSSHTWLRGEGRQVHRTYDNADMLRDMMTQWYWKEEWVMAFLGGIRCWFPWFLQQVICCYVGITWFALNLVRINKHLYP